MKGQEDHDFTSEIRERRKHAKDATHEGGEGGRREGRGHWGGVGDLSQETYPFRRRRTHQKEGH